jgi:Domain of unknown function (DUF1995)
MNGCRAAGRGPGRKSRRCPGRRAAGGALQPEAGQVCTARSPMQTLWRSTAFLPPQHRRVLGGRCQDACPWARPSELGRGSRHAIDCAEPKSCSGEAGIGLNVRRMRDQFLSTFTNTYSLRPIGDVGTVFRRYPGMWQVAAGAPCSGAASGCGILDASICVLRCLWR